MHALRLGLQGIELLSTGRITLPVPAPDRAYLRSIRRGERPLAEVLQAISDAEARLAALRGQRRDRRPARPPMGRCLAAPHLSEVLGPRPLGRGWPREATVRSG